ncbi:hypothetical protein ACFL2R_03165 [Patescibacteria group bacterium]
MLKLGLYFFGPLGIVGTVIFALGLLFYAGRNVELIRNVFYKFFKLDPWSSSIVSAFFKSTLEFKWLQGWLGKVFGDKIVSILFHENVLYFLGRPWALVVLLMWMPDLHVFDAIELVGSLGVFYVYYWKSRRDQAAQAAASAEQTGDVEGS